MGTMTQIKPMMLVETECWTTRVRDNQKVRYSDNVYGIVMDVYDDGPQYQGSLGIFCNQFFNSEYIVNILIEDASEIAGHIMLYETITEINESAHYQIEDIKSWFQSQNIKTSTLEDLIDHCNKLVTLANYHKKTAVNLMPPNVREKILNQCSWLKS